MKRRWIVLLSMSLGGLGCARSDQPKPLPPVAAVAVERGTGAVALAEVIAASAVVQAIDQKSRVLTLLTDAGERIRFRVSDDVQNLAQVKKGDQVNVGYYESVALRLRKPGEAAAGVTVAEEAERAKPGEMPAGAAAEVITVTSRVAEIDRHKQTVTLEMPNKERLSIKVEDAKRLAQVKPGDLVEATYREAIAVSVDRPGSP